MPLYSLTFNSGHSILVSSFNADLEDITEDLTSGVNWLIFDVPYSGESRKRIPIAIKAPEVIAISLNEE